MKTQIHTFIFPQFIADWLGSVSFHKAIFFEMMAACLLFVGLLASELFILIFLDWVLMFKALILFNLIAGTLFMVNSISMLYKQYEGEREMAEFQKEMGLIQ
jgi:hypothetical protein